INRLFRHSSRYSVARTKAIYYKFLIRQVEWSIAQIKTVEYAREAPKAETSESTATTTKS
ncbi:MAG: hypothetical protein MHPSP_001800, partial [Paramarteilia canceri]